MYCAFLFINVNAINVVPVQEHQSVQYFPEDVLAVPYSIQILLLNLQNSLFAVQFIGLWINSSLLNSWLCEITY